jgi:hypothetical protein
VLGPGALADILQELETLLVQTRSLQVQLQPPVQAPLGAPCL